jgi:hypothetical protein
MPANVWADRMAKAATNTANQQKPKPQKPVPAKVIQLNSDCTHSCAFGNDSPRPYTARTYLVA